MKKLFSIVLLLIYGLSSTAMTLHAHFCCGELTKIDFHSAICKDDCPAQPGVNGKSCCDEKQVSFSLNSDYDASKFIPLSVSDTFRPVYTEQVLVTFTSSTLRAAEIFEPPPLKRNLHILYSVYRI